VTAVCRTAASTGTAGAYGLGSAIAIYDAHPGRTDTPQSFYLHDAAGRRAGGIDGRVVAEIPNAFVG
jgi:hypothetical protein